MARTVRALVVDKPGEHRLVAGPVAEPGPGEVRIAVHAAGLCGGDLELYEGVRPPDRARYPVTPGHEWSGTVEAVGDGVDPGLLGRRTVGEAVRTCQVCERCRQGTTGCAAGVALTGYTEPGGCADVLIVPARSLHPLDDTADLRSAALLEPAAAAAAAVLAGRPRPGDRVAVVGAGMTGLLAVQLLTAYSPAALYVLDPWLRRAELGLAMGATDALLPTEADPLYGRCDVVLVAGGPAAGLTDACRLALPGGRIVLAGPVEADGHGLDPAVLTEHELTLRSAPGATPASWAHAVRAFRTGRLDLARLITHELPLDDFARALPLLDDTAPDHTKVLLRP
ncbi:alcohol dehydrogenase catalytic domain-containing protein [Streptomyces durbertensis]|uniref:2-deoxy-scyllo-inosamine dehydrogenase n=1 Tax=Streptomyces durbertensis TaxID=2448886 RepID=A0ABR6EMV4_9ACTN|nr:alcohol dehydrogenase catalytic domain-containing protein [Streptomyces durbertensis]MBB1246672.1 alcohol dehydrogenase catalytic domain-containing protein [Streptomyces durbertensis]